MTCKLQVMMDWVSQCKLFYVHFVQEIKRAERAQNFDFEDLRR